MCSGLTTDYPTRIFPTSCSWVGLWRVPSLLEGAAFRSCSGRRKWCPEHSEDVTEREKGEDFPDGIGEVGCGCGEKKVAQAAFIRSHANCRYAVSFSFADESTTERDSSDARRYTSGKRIRTRAPRDEDARRARDTRAKGFCVGWSPCDFSALDGAWTQTRGTCQKNLHCRLKKAC